MHTGALFTELPKTVHTLKLAVKHFASTGSVITMYPVTSTWFLNVIAN